MPNAPRSAYFTSVNPDLLARIPVTARHVLELGCGAGALCARFRHRAPGVRWSGIELVHDVAEAARGVLDAVLCGDIESVPDADLDAFLEGDVRPDVLVFGDVIEHLRDPEAVLARLVQRLTPGGTVVACIPNIGHWSAVEALLRGSWTYQDQGLFDRTHLRFFTADSAMALLAGAGLTVVKVSPRNIALDEARQSTFLAALRPALEELGVPLASAEANMRALQHVLVAVKPPSAPPLRVHTAVMVPDLMTARVRFPQVAMASLPMVVASSSERKVELPAVRPDQPRILVLQRQLVAQREAWLASMASIVRQGWLVVAEWDDHPELLPPGPREVWQREPWLPFSGVHAVQVSTPALAEALRAHNPEVAVLPNALLDVPPHRQRHGPDIRIVCAAMSRPGLEPLVGPALERAARADPRVCIDIVANPELFRAVEAPRKRHHDPLPYFDYLNLLGSADISIMPIRGSEPERYKSPLKFMESAAGGAACVGSPFLYAGVIEHGANGLLAETPQEWTQALLALVTDHDLRRRVAEAGWRSVRERHMQAHHVAARVAWYRDLWSRRAVLRQSLAERHPAFAP